MKVPVLLLVALVLAAGFVWMRYGTASPCAMLKEDLRAALLGSGKTAGAPGPADDTLQRLGRALGTTLLDPALDLALKDRSPAECLRGLARLHLERAAPEDVLLDR